MMLVYTPKAFSHPLTGDTWYAVSSSSPRRNPREQSARRDTVNTWEAQSACLSVSSTAVPPFLAGIHPEPHALVHSKGHVTGTIETLVKPGR